MPTTADGLWYDLIAGPKGSDTVLLSAGLGGSANFWAPQMYVLKQRFNVLLYDHRGTGRSVRSLTDPHSVDAMAAALDARGPSTAKRDRESAALRKDLDALVKQVKAQDATIAKVKKQKGGGAAPAPAEVVNLGKDIDQPSLKEEGASEIVAATRAFNIMQQRTF